MQHHLPRCQVAQAEGVAQQLERGRAVDLGRDPVLLGQLGRLERFLVGVDVLHRDPVGRSLVARQQLAESEPANYPEQGAGDLGVDASAVGASGAKVKRLDYFVPELGEGAEMLEGSTEEIVEKLIEMLKAKGGLK